MRNSVIGRIEDNAQKFTAGGIEAARLIKSDLADLIEQLPQTCVHAIGTQDQWPHRRTSAEQSSCEAKTCETYSAASFRRAISPLGMLLAKHELLTEKEGYIPEWEKAGNGYRYATNPGFDERRFPALQEYNRKRQEQKKLLEQLQDMSEELGKVKARELWDEA